MDDMLNLCVECGEIGIDEDHICELRDINEDSNFVISTNEGNPQHTEVQNIEELINEVFKRAPLWDSTLPYEKRGPSITKLLWSEIDKRLNLRPGTASVLSGVIYVTRMSEN